MKFDEKRSGRKPQDHHRRGPRPAKAPRSAFAAMESMDQVDIPAEQENSTLIEGRNAITEALRSGRPMDKIFLAEGVQGVQHILAMAKEAGYTTLANMVLMGKLIKETGAVSFANNQATFEKFIPAKKAALIEQNCQALQAGHDF